MKKARIFTVIFMFTILISILAACNDKTDKNNEKSEPKAAEPTYNTYQILDYTTDSYLGVLPTSEWDYATTYNDKTVLKNKTGDYIQVGEQYKDVKDEDVRYYRYYDNYTHEGYAPTSEQYETVYQVLIDHGSYGEYKTFKNKTDIGYKYSNSDTDYSYYCSDAHKTFGYIVGGKLYYNRDSAYLYSNPSGDSCYYSSVYGENVYIINDAYYLSMQTVYLYFNSATDRYYAPQYTAAESYYSINNGCYKYKVSGFYKYDNGTGNVKYSTTNATLTERGYLIDYKYYTNKTSGIYGYNNSSSSAGVPDIDYFSSESVAPVSGYLINGKLYTSLDSGTYYRYYNTLNDDSTKENYYSNQRKTSSQAYTINGKIYTQRASSSMYKYSTYTNYSQGYTIHGYIEGAYCYILTVDGIEKYYQNKSSAYYYEFYNDSTDVLFTDSSQHISSFYSVKGIGNCFRSAEIYAQYDGNFYLIQSGNLFVSGNEVLLCYYKSCYKPKVFKVNTAVAIESKLLLGKYGGIVGYGNEESVYRVKFEKDDNYYLVVGLAE